MRTEWVHQNPEASRALRVPIVVECNTSAERIMDNIRRNSEAIRTGWQKLEAAHERTAILCGSGPSLADTLEEIRSMGGDVFAMNGAAAFLDRNGILPDYQVIMDARRETADLIGPARQHLFCAQVDPECFDRVPAAKLWHTTYGDVVPEFPDYADDYCLVGGAISVGNAALALAYAMGYRTIHCFGFDSSHRDSKGHAFGQPLNADDPTTIVQFDGKSYVASITMALQADYFMERAHALQSMGAKIHVHGSGLLPDRFNAYASEQEKYRAMWAIDGYRNVSPGEEVAETFVQVCKVTGNHSVADIGCGTGRGGQRIHELTGCRVELFDFAENCLDKSVDLPFTVADLTHPIPTACDFAFCTDVMEHIPPEDIEAVLNNVLGCAAEAFFQISLVPDHMGSEIGHPLHLTVRPFEWWADQFHLLGASIKWSENRGDTALFHVSTT
jgi:hypothetical protein